MVDTFTCDSCGKNSVPTTSKAQILVKESVPTGQLTQKGKQQMQTVTIGMDICPDCKMNGIIRNHLKISADGEPDRHFTWNPNPSKQNTYIWGDKGTSNQQQK